MTIKPVLRKCKVFSGLSDAELEKIVPWVKQKEYEAGSTIFQEGDKAEELFVLEEGRIAIQMSLPLEQGKFSNKVTVDVLSSGEIFGWSAKVEAHSYCLAATCLQNVKALSINGNKLNNIMRDHPGIGIEVLGKIVQIMASRLEETRALLISERIATPHVKDPVGKL